MMDAFSAHIPMRFPVAASPFVCWCATCINVPCARCRQIFDADQFPLCHALALSSACGHHLVAFQFVFSCVCSFCHPHMSKVKENGHDGTLPRFNLFFGCVDMVTSSKMMTFSELHSECKPCVTHPSSTDSPVSSPNLSAGRVLAACRNCNLSTCDVDLLWTSSHDPAAQNSTVPLPDARFFVSFCLPSLSLPWSLASTTMTMTMTMTHSEKSNQRQRPGLTGVSEGVITPRKRICYVCTPCSTDKGDSWNSARDSVQSHA